MKSKAVRYFQYTEIFGLYVLALSLPIMESPKHFAIVVFAIGALGWRLLQRPIGWRKPDTFEWLLLSMWLVSLASTLANWPLERGIHGFKNISCMLLLFWAMYRNTYKESQMRLFLWIIIAAVMLGLLQGLWEWKSGIRDYLEFHSAGVVTQSAIYLSISISLMFGIFLDNTSGFTTTVRVAMAACLLFSLLCLLMMGSRGGVLAVIITAGLLSLKFLRNKRFQLALGIGLGIGVAVIIGAHVSTENSVLTQRIKHLTSNLSKGGLNLGGIGLNDRLRFELWMVGYAQATQGGHMLLGIGPRNFPSIKVDQLRFRKPLVTYPSVWQKPNHAHNLFLTKWCEEGVLGLAAFLLFLAYIAKTLFKHRPKHKNIHWSWVGALGALTVPVVAGLFSSPFRTEFSWLAMMIMGLFIARVEREEAQKVL